VADGSADEAQGVSDDERDERMNTVSASQPGAAMDSAGRHLDQVRLVGITAIGYHGVFEHERREGQTFTADVVAHMDTRPAAATDSLALTLDYGVLAEQVAAVLAGEPVDLIETVAERIAATVLAHRQVAVVDVAVHKPQAPLTVPFDDVVVSIRRDRTKLPAAEPWTPQAAVATSHVSEESKTTAVLPPVEPTWVPEPAHVAVHAALPVAVHAALPVADPDSLDDPPLAAVDAVLALGSNLGAPQDTLRRAIADLDAVDGIEIVAVSPLARSAPVGVVDQPDFLNAVVLARTTLSPRALLHTVQGIETAHGRERLERWGPRTLDIDIIVFGSTLAVTDDLELPHPRAHQRAFVLQPWVEIAPDAVLPGLGGGPVAALAATAPDRDGIRWLALDWLVAPAESVAVVQADPAPTGWPQ
jgi:dihydroneopterin aldolase/2-amino-4-hydroxy-6-hydroxymethyldihydropteridine diphosphokinase